MGRRALPKIDPTLDLSKHFFELQDWPPGKPVVDLFAVKRPLEIEVGCGKGLFLHNAAKQSPETNFLGVEIGSRYARFAAAKLAAAQLPNAAMFRGCGEKMLREHVADGSVSAVHVYFPDPWWKSRHRKRRVMNEQFVKRIVDILHPDGQLHFWTDVEEYFNVTLRLLGEQVDLTGPICVEESAPRHDFDYRTHFERRMRRLGKPIYRSLFLKHKDEKRRIAV